MGLYISADRASLVTIEDSNGNCLVYRGTDITENTLNLTISLFQELGSLPVTGEWPDRIVIILYGELDSCTVTSKNDDLYFSVWYEIAKDKLS